ncbi:hypothetical protein ACIQVO_12880 [Streptomyces sp. NPDC101062]|uniref:hypothetical protein n=1 Tax=Streptomyces sp. NPDC101062 TaxID=3366103 RepID=UPI00381B4C1B
MTDVALGTSDNGLEKWATDNEYTHFMGETCDGSIANTGDAMNYHPEVNIHVRLDGFALKDRMPGTPGDDWGTTQREMAFLERAFRVGNLDASRLTFYLGGSDITAGIFKGSKYLRGS